MTKLHLTDNKPSRVAAYQLRCTVVQAVKDCMALLDDLPDDVLDEVERDAIANVAMCPGMAETDFMAAIVDIVRRLKADERSVGQPA